MLVRPIGANWLLSNSDSFYQLPEKDLKLQATNSQVFSAHGVSFAVCRRFYHSGNSHTLILGPSRGRLRSLTFLEAWSLQGGWVESFYNHNSEYLEQAIIPTTPVAMQIHITGFALGALAHFQGEPTRVGGRTSV